MPKVTGSDEVKRFLAAIPGQLEKKVLRGAARAAGKVVADEAKDRCVSDRVASGIKVRTKREIGRVEAKVQTRGRFAYIAPWLEYGTDPHFISVEDDQRQGLSVRKVNEGVKAGSLVIGGKFVGDTVLHPGARPHPFMAVSLDVKAAEATAAAQRYINARVGRAGVTGADEGDDA